MRYLISIVTFFFAYPHYRINYVNLLKIFHTSNLVILICCTCIVPLELASAASCMCGKSNDNGLRIVGGVVTKANEFPWQVGIATINGSPFCGGSLLNNRYVITAGHCIYRLHASSLMVILGEHNRVINNKYRKTMRVIGLILHPQFRKKGLLNDIGLIKMAAAIPFSNSQRPACMLRPSTVLDGAIGVVSGWGRTMEDGKTAPVLRKVSVDIISLAECRRAFGKRMILSSTICGMVAGGGKDACQGDSGGPLTYYRNKRYYLIGLVSWGIGCARPNNPGIYTRVDKFYQWIDENTRDAAYCSN